MSACFRDRLGPEVKRIGEQCSKKASESSRTHQTEEEDGRTALQFFVLKFKFFLSLYSLVLEKKGDLFQFGLKRELMIFLKRKRKFNQEKLIEISYCICFEFKNKSENF